MTNNVRKNINFLPNLTDNDHVNATVIKKTK